MGTLTVRENLYFSASLRLPNSMSWADKKARVEKILDELGLTDCADTKVHVPIDIACICMTKLTTCISSLFNI